MNYICESCGSYLKYYDKVSRMVRTKNRKASIITVKRFKCPVCNCIHRNLPNNIFPYKQYDARIITGVIEGKIAFIIGSVVGVGIGVAGTYSYFKDKYEKLAEEDFNSTKK